MSASREKKVRQELAAQGIPDIKEIRAAEERKQHRRANILYGSIAAAFVLVAAALMIWNSNIIQRGSTAISVGDEKYSAAEVNYYYYNAYNSVASGTYASYLSLNNAYPLDQQTLGEFDLMLLGLTLEEGETMTWHDYILNLTKDSMVQQTALLKGAKEAKFELSDEMQENIDGTMEMLKEYAKQSGTSINTYLKSIYGASMTANTFKKLLTDATLTSAFQQEFVDSLVYTDAEIDQYYAENSENIDIVSYEYVLFNGTAASTKDADGKTVEPTEEEQAAAKAAAETAAKAAYARYEAGEDLETIAKDYDMASYVSQDAGVNSGGVLQEWLYDDSRVAGDKTQLENGSSFYVLGFRDRSREEYNTVDVRHILCMVDDSELDSTADDYKEKLQALIDAEKAEAEAILKEWQDGAKTPESFGELANKKSDDGGSNTNGGLYEQIYKGQMVTEFEEWAFDASRRAGDTGIVFVEAANYTGYHVMYFEGYNDPYWKALAINNKMNDDYNVWFEGLMEGLTAEEHSGIKYVG